MRFILYLSIFSEKFIIGTDAAVMLTAVMILLYYDEVKKITDKFKNRKVKV